MVIGLGRRLRLTLAEFLNWRVLLLLGLLLVVFRSLTAGLAEVTRGLDIEILLPSALGGLFLGWALASWGASGRLGSALAVGSGLAFIFVRLGNLGGLLWELLKQLVLLGSAVARWPFNGPPDLTPVSLLLGDLLAGFFVLLERALEWAVALASGNPTFDPVGAAFAWSLILWIMAAWASWGVRREWSPLLAVLPPGLLFAVTVAFTRVGVTRLLPLLGATLLLTALVNQDAREQRWKSIGIVFPNSLARGVGLTATVLTIALVIVAGVSPSISFRRLVEFAQRFTDSRSEGPSLADSLGLQPAAPSREDPFSEMRAPGLPRRHLMGSGPELSDRVVMIVALEEAAVSAAPELPPFYWRSLTYDVYTGRGWSASGNEVTLYEAGERTIPIDSPYHYSLEQDVRTVEALGGLVHVSGELVTLDHPFEAAWRGAGDLFGATSESNSYHAESIVPVVDQETLRAAGDEYPQWVRDRYLALPENLPSRVRSLALSLTATEPTPYDRAKAIEAYLRTFPYTLEVGPPLPGRDVVDYFLFDLREGYCDYYATTMVVLARAAGIPARLAVGYVAGTYDSRQSRYIVTEAEAHSWVEVYIPEIGWVSFEPTGGRPALDRPEKATLVVPPELERPLFPQVTDVTLWVVLGALGLAGGFSLLAVGVVAWNQVDRYRLERMPPSAVVARLYRRLQRFARRLSVPLKAGHTPYELSRGMRDHLQQIPTGERWKTLLSPGADEASELAELAVLAQYSPRPLTSANRTRALRLWALLQRRLMLAWVWTWLKGWIRMDRFRR